MNHILSPDDCRTMTEVRAGVDAVDRELVSLLGRRFGYMRAAARIKADRGHVRDATRKAQVIANAALLGERHSIPRPIVERLWDHLVEESIAYELERFDEKG
jgi:isochorismate pyruvate lyase